ncbi:hypothetical protein FRC03_010264 [Tulasnella sp. 419]|nr:hypothetical protein FRC03_010264 [Tulasnella sp. 419]
MPSSSPQVLSKSSSGTQSPANDAPSEQDTTAAALYVATAVLEQALDFLVNSVGSDEQLAFQSRLLPGSTIGKHMRHARDHFNLLVQSVGQGKPPYPLSYDVRTRDTPMEKSLSAAREQIRTSIADLKRVFDPDRGIGAEAEVELSAITPFPLSFKSSVGRELWFVALHAIHHFAVIRVLAGELGLVVDHEFGVAPSTLRYRAQNQEGKEARAKI